MATTVGQHSVAAFTSPINGTTPIDANTVRSNDNTVRLAYVDHDADTGIHVQSSTLASRPVAGTAGRKWITDESGVYTLWFDDGVNWHPVSSEAVALTVLCTTALNRGDVVKVVGWNNGQDLPEVAKVASSSDIAFAVMTQNATINTMGYAINTGTLQDIDTAAFSVGNILYPNTTGGFTATKPTSGVYQPVAFVLRSNATNGVVYVEFSAPRIVEASTNTASTVVLRDGSGNFSAGTITANLTGNITGTAPAGTLTGTTLASNVVSSSLTSVGTLTSLAVNGNVTVGASKAVISSTTGTLTITHAAGAAVNLVGGNSYQLYADGSNNFGLFSNTAGVNRLVVDSSGNLGLGVTPSAWTTISGGALQLSGSGAIWSTGVTDVFLSQNTFFNGSYRYVSTNAAAAYRQLAGEHQWLSAVSGTAGNAITFSQVMTLNTAGNLGLGVIPSTASIRTLQINSTSLSSPGTQTYLTANAVFDSPNWKYISSTFSSQYVQLNGGHQWLNAASGTAGTNVSFTQAMTLDASGNLGIGTTPSNRLHIAGYSSANQTPDINITRSSSGTLIQSGPNITLADGTTNNTVALQATQGRFGVWNYGAGAWNERLSVDASGNLGLGVTPSAWSGFKAFDIGAAGGIASDGGGTFITKNAYDSTGSGGWRYKATASASLYLQQAGGAHAWYTAASGTAGNAITFTQAMTLDASGNLGVGVTGTITHRTTINVPSGADRSIFLAGVTGTSNGFTVSWSHSTTKTHVNIANIPTSSAGLPAGTLWSDAGTIKIA